LEKKEKNRKHDDIDTIPIFFLYFLTIFGTVLDAGGDKFVQSVGLCDVGWLFIIN